MTSALRWEGELAQKQTIVLMGCSSVSEKGEGVQKSQIFVDVICERPLISLVSFFNIDYLQYRIR